MKASKVRNRLRNERKSRERDRKRLSRDIIAPGESVQIRVDTKWQQTLVSKFGASTAWLVVDDRGPHIELHDNAGKPVAIMAPEAWNRTDPPEGRYIWRG